MRSLFILFTVALVFTAFKIKEEFFNGKIVYEYTFTDLQGNDLNDKMASYLGRGQDYYINHNNYKSLRQNKLVQLYNSGTNNYYYFTDAKAALQIDGSKSTSQKFSITKLDNTELIAGYECKAIQIETNEASTIYYYSPQIKTDPSAFKKHSFGEWNKYLAATEGALALKYIMTNKKQGFIWTSTAKEITQLALIDADFVLPDYVQVKK